MREKPHRLNRNAYKGQVAVAFTCCFRPRGTSISNESTFKAMLSILSKALDKHRCTAPIVTLMPDHLHLLLRGTDKDSDTYAACHSFKIGSARWLRANHPGVSMQDDFYDSAMKPFEGWFERASYMWMNPVRLGLVKDPGDWPYTASIGHDLESVLSRHG